MMLDVRGVDSETCQMDWTASTHEAGIRPSTLVD